MKHCPQCGQRYSDANINFCLEDGELLMDLSDGPPTMIGGEPPRSQYADDQPPTVLMNPTRVTNSNWNEPGGPPAPWQTNQTMQPTGYTPPMIYNSSPDQTLPIVSLALSLGALIFVCCFGGFWLGIPAAVVGYIGMSNADKDPTKYGGRGMAIAGMVIGIVAFFISLIHIFASVLAN